MCLVFVIYYLDIINNLCGQIVSRPSMTGEWTESWGGDVRVEDVEREG